MEQIKSEGQMLLDVISPYQLTSLLVQHDQSPDTGIFTLTDGKGRWREEREK